MTAQPSLGRGAAQLVSGFSFLECPRWHDGRLWLSDFFTDQVVAVDVDGSVELILELAGEPGGLGWLPDGRLLVVSRERRQVWRLEATGELVLHADLAPHTAFAVNDMVLDGSGRAYVGTFGFDMAAKAAVRPGMILIVEPDGAVRVGAEDLVLPNGMTISGDGTTLIVAETFGQCLTAFDRTASGDLARRRDWARLGERPHSDDLAALWESTTFAPDGMCLDADGAIWVADAFGSRVLRLREGGEVLEEIRTPGLLSFACMLGGADGRTLFVCVTPPPLGNRRRKLRDAAVLAYRVDVGHAGRP